LRGNDAEAYNNQGNRKRCCGIEYKVVAIGLEIDAYCCHLWQKEIVKQINIERPTTNELKTPTYHCLIREKLLIVSEEHKNHREQQKHGQSMWQRSPFVSQIVPHNDIECTNHSQYGDYRKKPITIHQLLSLVPITMHDISEEEKRKIAHHLN
jgi:hypothetical protein